MHGAVYTHLRRRTRRRAALVTRQPCPGTPFPPTQPNTYCSLRMCTASLSLQSRAEVCRQVTLIHRLPKHRIETSLPSTKPHTHNRTSAAIRKREKAPSCSFPKNVAHKLLSVRERIIHVHVYDLSASELRVRTPEHGLNLSLLLTLLLLLSLNRLLSEASLCCLSCSLEASNQPSTCWTGTCAAAATACLPVASKSCASATAAGAE